MIFSSRIPRSIALIALTLSSFPASAQQGLGTPLDGISRLKNYEARRVSSVDPNLESGNADARPIEAGQTLTLAELEGPGVITHIWNTVASPERAYSRLLVLQMYWDGETSPSVECPLGDFFAVGHGVDAVVNTLPVAVASDGRGRNSYWPMPFRKSARVTVTNEGTERTHAFYYYLDWQQLNTLPDDEAYFHAQYRQEHPTIMGRNYLTADITGRGHYVGTVLNCRARSPEWWGEGDDFFYIDGETTPSLQGTGTEDYFCDGWGFRKFDGLHTGCTVWEGNEKQGGRTTVYRWHVADPIPFKKSLRLEFEHKGVTFKPDGTILTYFAEREDDWSSVAFWYQVEPHKAWEPIPYGYKRLYYDRKTITEAEQTTPSVLVSAGYFDPQKLDRTSGGAQILWSVDKADQVLTATINAADGGLYDLYLLTTQSWDYGIFDLQLDGRQLGRTSDFYSAEVKPLETFFPSVKLTAGKHELSFVNRGKNDASKGWRLGVDAWVLVPRGK